MMDPELVRVGPVDTLGRLRPLVESAEGYAAEARAPRTREAYRRQWAGFVAWCSGLGLQPLPAHPETVALFLAARAEEGRKVATLALALTSISEAHRLADHPSPRGSRQVREVWKGIRRRLGTAPTEQAPITARDIRLMVAAQPAGLRGDRNRALLTLGFAGGFRRSELVAVAVADLAFVNEGLEVHVRKSKTDPEARGMLKVVCYGSDPATCPVRALRTWLERAAISQGPVFRAVDRHGRVSSAQLGDRAVARVVQELARHARLDASKLAGHSLRAGFVSEASRNGADDRAVMQQTGHRSVAMLRRYDRRVQAWDRPASAKLGL